MNCTDQFELVLGSFNTKSSVSSILLDDAFWLLGFQFSTELLNTNLSFMNMSGRETNEDPWSPSLDYWTAEKSHLAHALASFTDLERVSDVDGVEAREKTRAASRLGVSKPESGLGVGLTQRKRSPARGKSVSLQRPESNLESETPANASAATENNKENLPSPSPTRKIGLKPKDYLGRLFPKLAQECSFATDGERSLDEAQDSASEYNRVESSDEETLETTPRSPNLADVEDVKSEERRRKAPSVPATPNERPLIGQIIHDVNFATVSTPPSKVFAASKVTERM
jgi:hypothetical protein